MGVLLDVVTVAVVAWCIYTASRKGFVKALIGFVGTFLAIGAAMLFAGSASAALESRWIGPFFEGAVRDYLGNLISGTGDSAAAFVEQLNTLIADMPEVLAQFLQRFSVTAPQVQEAVSSSASAQQAQEAAVAAIAGPLSGAVSYALGFLLVFLAATLATRVITVVLDALMQLPILRSVNGSLGLLVGVLQGVVIACLFAGVVTYLAPFLNNYLAKGFDANTISATLVFKYFYQISPFKRLL